MCCVDTVRNEVLPSIDIARKIADILEVSLNYLTGKEDVQIDKDTSSSILRYLNLKRLTKTISSPLLMHLLLKGKYNLFYNKKRQAVKPNVLLFKARITNPRHRVYTLPLSYL